MRATRVPSIAGAAMLVVALANGCTDSSAGTPLPRETGISDTEAPSEPSGPARPRELRLDGKDPCALVPESDWPRFYIEKPGKPRHSETFNSPGCFYSNNVGGFGVTLVVTEGIEAMDESKRNIQRTDVPPIAGFSSIAVRLPDDKNSCDVAVDVADGQYLLAGLDITLSELSEVPEPCEYAYQLAESAMKTLIAS
jgi:hypothetical protein